MRRLKILIWHIHGSYLNSLACIDHDWYLPFRSDRGPGYGGLPRTFNIPPNMREVPAEQVRDIDLDLIIFQTPQNYTDDQYEILSDAQRRLPAIYLEHNTPRPHPSDTRHVVDNPEMLLVHVTHFNRLMWDNGRTPAIVIEHSVAVDPELRYRGERAQGISVVNGMAKRPRIAGYDLFLQARAHVPLEIAGMGSEELGGLGDLPYPALHRRMAEYRFLFSPMRYTSLPLAVIEAMTIGMPIVALATTELPGVIESGLHGYISCNPDELNERMRALIKDAELARRLGANARALAHERFSMQRFVHAWNQAFSIVLS